MRFVRAIKQGNSIMLSIPANLRTEMSINRSDYFSVSATDLTTLQYHKMIANDKITPSTHKSKGKNNAARKPHSRKHSHK